MRTRDDEGHWIAMPTHPSRRVRNRAVGAIGAAVLAIMIFLSAAVGAVPTYAAPPGQSVAVQPALDQQVIGWGDDTYGQATVPVTARSGVIAISAGRLGQYRPAIGTRWCCATPRLHRGGR